MLKKNKHRSCNCLSYHFQRKFKKLLSYHSFVSVDIQKYPQILVFTVMCLLCDKIGFHVIPLDHTKPKYIVRLEEAIRRIYQQEQGIFDLRIMLFLIISKKLQRRREERKRRGTRKSNMQTTISMIIMIKRGQRRKKRRLFLHIFLDKVKF